MRGLELGDKVEHPDAMSLPLGLAIGLLKGPDGTVSEYVARNPENLKRAAVGDLVVMTVTESVAITVEEQSAD